MILMIKMQWHGGEGAELEVAETHDGAGDRGNQQRDAALEDKGDG